MEKLLSLFLVIGFSWAVADAKLYADPGSDAGAKQPNIVLIYGDDVGYGDVGCYGAKGIRTPNIDRLAKEGLRLTDAHCSAATCTPSRFTLLTGSYAFRNPRAKILRGDAALIIKPGTPTLASVLKGAGYRTGVVGKWHLGLGDGTLDWNQKIQPGPNEIGFDYHFLIPATGDRVPCVYVEQGKVVGLEKSDPIRTSYGRKIGDAPTGKERPDLLKQKWSHGHNSTIINGISRIGFMTGGQQARWVDEDMSDTISKKAVEFIERNQTKPFFLFFSAHDIHVPRVPHRRFVGKSGQGPRGDAMMQFDDAVGQLMQALEKNELAENTMVIFTSDNGLVLDDGYRDQANEKIGNHRPAGLFRGGKYSLFEAGTRVPTIVRYPGVVRPSSESRLLAGQVDLPRTLASLCQAEIPKAAFPDSRNQESVWLGNAKQGRPHLVHEAGRLALRMNHWKYIPGGGRTREKLGPWKQVRIPDSGLLFHLGNDPGEQDNLAEKFPQQLIAMKRRLKKLRSQPDSQLEIDASLDQ